VIAGNERERESCATSYVKGGTILVQAYHRPVGFQEAEAPRFLASWCMMVVRLSALHTGCLYLPGNIPGTNFY